MPTSISLTGRPTVHAEYREVWADQVDDFGEPCTVCQLEANTIQATVYVPVHLGSREVIGACLCCIIPAILDMSDYDPTRDVLVEYSKGANGS